MITPLDFLTLPKDGMRFESLVKQLLESMGYRILEKPAVGVEGGRDILIERHFKDAMAEFRERVVVQCKHHAHSGRAVSDKDVGIWQNALARYQARGYLLVTDVRVTENISRSFREFTNDPANSPKWATYWDVDELCSLLLAKPSVAEAFFPRATRPLAGVDLLADEIQSWVTALGYSITDVRRVPPRCIRILARVIRAGLSTGVRIHCVDGELTHRDVIAIHSEMDDAFPIAWVISETRVSSRSRAITARHAGITVFTFAEFLETVIWQPYFKCLRETVASTQILTFYVDSAGYKVDFDSKGEESGRDTFDSLSEYVNGWVKETSTHQLALLGDFGAGKTWFCRHYAYHQLNRFLADPLRERVPLLIPLREFRDMNADQLISSALVQHYHLPFMADPTVVFKNLAAQGRLLLLLDGFDESTRVADREGLGRAFQFVRELAVMNNKVLVTSRTEYFRSAADADKVLNQRDGEGQAHVRFDVVYVAPFDEDRIAAALRKRCPEAQHRDISRSLRENLDLIEMVRKPVALSMFMSMPELIGMSSTNQAVLYARTIEHFLLRNVTTNGTFTSTKDKLLFLCELAWMMFTDSTPRVHYSQFPRTIRNHFAARLKGETELDVWDSELRAQTMLHRDTAGYYEFAHRSYVEFFVALKLAREIGTISTPVKAAFRDSNRFLKSRPKLNTPALDDTFGRLPLTEPRMAIVSTFLVDLLGSRSEARLKQILRGSPSRSFTQSNAASVLVKMGISLAGENLSRKSLPQTDFEGADLRKATLNGGDFSGSDFSNAYLAGADFRGAQLQGILFDHVSGVRIVRLLSKTEQIVTGSTDGTVEVWRTNRQRPTLRIRAGLASGLGDVRLSRSELEIFTVDRNGRVRVWDTGTGKLISETHVGGLLVSSDTSRDGRYFAVMDWSTGNVTVLDLADFHVVHEFKSKRSRVGYDVRFSPNDRYIAAAHIDGGAAIWDVSTGRLVAKLDGHNSKAESVCFAAQGKYVITGGYDRMLRVWRSDDWSLVRELQESAMIAEVASTDTRSVLLTGLHSGGIGVWDLEAMRRIRVIRRHRGSVYGLAMSEDAHRMASSGRDGTIQLFDLSAMAAIGTLEQALRCPGLRLHGVSGLRAETRSILLARGADG